jgi:hypothetical protein
MSIGSVNAADAYAVAVIKKEQDQDKVKGDSTVRLIESANANAQAKPRVPGADSTFSVIV